MVNKGTSYWMDVDNFDKDNPIYLAKVKKSISNFVNILTGKSIPVTYATNGDSYTDGEHIVISSNISKKNLDVTVGLTLHEASHILLTDFEWLSNGFNRFIEKIKNITTEDRELILLLTNFVEDRRIDNYVYTQAPGYSTYYKSLYEKYFFSTIIDKGLQSDKYTDQSIEAYLFRVINILNRNSDLGVMPGLKEIYDILDIKNINRIQNTQHSAAVAIEMYEVIKRHIKEKIPPSDEEKKHSNNKLEKDFKTQKDFTQGKVKKTHMSKKSYNEVEELSNSVFSNVNVDETKGRIGNTSTEVIVTNKWVCETNMKYSKGFNNGVVDSGIRDGKKLLNKLTPIIEIRNRKLNGLKKGKLDPKKLHKSSFAEDIFYKNEIELFKDTFIHISIDASGSMNGKKFYSSLRTAISIAYAACYIKGFNVEISLRGEKNIGNKRNAVLAYVFDSRKNKVSDLRKLNTLGVSGGTPEGLCLSIIKDKLPKPNQLQDVYLVNLSDGMPTAPYALKQKSNDIDDLNIWFTSKVVKNIKNNGVKVLSYFIPDGISSVNILNIKNFKKMYGNNASFIDVNNISNIANTVNKLLIDNKVMSL